MYQQAVCGLLNQALLQLFLMGLLCYLTAWFCLSPQLAMLSYRSQILICNQPVLHCRLDLVRYFDFLHASHK